MITHLKSIEEKACDFRATVKVAELIENSVVSSDDIVVIPVGAKDRGFAKDIKGYVAYYSEFMRQNRMILEMNREGLYDMLPEGLFHTPPVRIDGLSADTMIDDVKRKSSEERSARTFFMPFEAELNHLRVIADLYENRLDKRSAYHDLSSLFGPEWHEFDLLDHDQRTIWMHLLPLIKVKRNDTAFLCETLALLFNIPVDIRYDPTAVVYYPIPDELQFSIGKGSLGVDSVIGEKFASEQDQVVISIGPANAKKLVRFMPGTVDHKLFSMILEYLVPIGTNVHLILISNPEDKISILGDDTDKLRLGYTVYL